MTIPHKKMKGIKFRFNIDKLKLCYHQPSDLFEKFVEISSNKSIDQGDYRLFVIKDEEKEKKGKMPTALSVNIQIPDENGEWQLLGTLTLHSNASDFEGYAFFQFDNKVFYTFLTGDGRGNKYSIIPIIQPITYELGLTFSHVSTLDVALDTNVNLISKIRNLVKTHQQKGLEMIFNNRKIGNPNLEIIGWKEIYSRTCNKLIKNPSLYFTQKDENAPELCIYDKSREIENESGKNYIAEWNDIGKRIYRSEIRLKRKEIRKFFKNRPLPEGFELETLQEQQTLFDIWHTFTHRLLHFTNPSTRKTFDIVDLLET